MPAARFPAQVMQDPAEQPDPAEQHIGEGRDEDRQYEVGLCRARRDERQQGTECCGQEGDPPNEMATCTMAWRSEPGRSCGRVTSAPNWKCRVSIRRTGSK